MNNVIDITNKIKINLNKEQMNSQLFDISELIDAGRVKEIIGVLVDIDGNYYPIMPYENTLTADFISLLNESVNKLISLYTDKGKDL